MTVNRRATLAAALVAVLAIGYANFLSRAAWEIDLWPLVLAPAAAVAWVYPPRTALVFGVFAAACVVVSSDGGDGFPLVSTMGELVVDTLTFLTFSGLVGLLARTLGVQTQLARFDPLTATASAARFRALVEQELLRARRYDHSTTVAYLDVDNFKMINDEHGHHTGDVALQSVATVISQQLRHTDVVGRLGGDEFGILMPETGEDAAHLVLNRIKSAVGELAFEKTWPIGVSIGATVVAGSCADATCEEVIKRADMQMYRVKSGSKNGVLVEAFGAPGIDS
jgi:diguanylate cyclase (GGDEF)-like protein